MAAVLSTNMASLYAQKNLSTAQASLSASVQRLSSGTRINSAKDDAAGYGISESLKGTKNIVDQNIRNAKDGISYAQVAEGALDVVGKILQRSLTLITQRQDDTLNDDQRNSIDAELDSLKAEVNNIAVRTKFQGGGNEVSVFGSNAINANGVAFLEVDPSGNVLVGGDRHAIDVTNWTDLSGNTMIDVSGNTTAVFDLDSLASPPAIVYTGAQYNGMDILLSQATFADVLNGEDEITGAYISALDPIEINGRLYLLGLDTDQAQHNGSSSISVETGSYDATQVVATMIDPSDINGQSSVDDIAALIAENATNRSSLGSAINSLEYAVDNMQTLSTNLADGISRIVDTDYAAETSNLTRTQILQQAATSMLAQANQMPNVILTLLK